MVKLHAMICQLEIAYTEEFNMAKVENSIH